MLGPRAIAMAFLALATANAQDLFLAKKTDAQSTVVSDKVPETAGMQKELAEATELEAKKSGNVMALFAAILVMGIWVIIVHTETGCLIPKKDAEAAETSCFGLMGPSKTDKYKAELKKAKQLVIDLVKEKDCAPILVRLAWHDSGTFDKNNASKPWPNAGGAIGSIRTDHEINAGPNAGLSKALTAYLQPIKDKVPTVSWADLIQMASAVAIETVGGPKIDMKYGRVDGIPTETQPPPFGLPGVCFDEDPVKHLKYVFYKYGMDDKDIVALSGAHTLGRAFQDRSGTVKEASTGPFTAYTKRGCPEMGKSMTAGGRSWTKNWTKFDNSYFTDMAKNDPETVAFPTDKCLMTAPEFKQHFEAFKDQSKFFAAYAASHKKLSELGSKFEPAEGITGI